MSECEYGGCAAEAVEEVPTLERPSPVPRDHPDYTPPKTTVAVCAEHTALARLRAAALEQELLGGEGPDELRRGG